MNKIIKSDKKIKYTLLSIIFLILFMVTTIYYPINTYAGDEPAIGQTQNLKQYAANERDESAQNTAGYLYCAASERRCGAYFYVVDGDGKIQARGLLMDERACEYDKNYAHKANKKLLSTRVSLHGSTDIDIEYIEGASPVYYDDGTGWNARGSAVMNYLTADSGKKILIGDVKVPAPRWATYVAKTEGGMKSLEELAKPETEWQLFLEPVSTNYLYTTGTFDKKVDNYIVGHNDFTAGHYVPLGHYVDDAETIYEPNYYLGTGMTLFNECCREIADDAKVWKFYKKQLPYSLCLEHDEEIPCFSGYSSFGTATLLGVPEGSIKKLNSISDIYAGNTSYGVAIAALEIKGFQLPPIHTYDPGKGTPGNPETPDPEKGTDGDCVITKLYYTEVLSPDGEPVETKDFYSYRMSNTTNYISIDEEEGYEIEAWRASSTNFTISKNTTGIQTIKRMPGTGSGSSVETLDVDNGQKYLYVLYKKVEVQEEESEFDFEILESQITNRVSFYQGTSKTKELVMKEFSWRSEEHYPTSCIANSGNGHSISCPYYNGEVIDTYWYCDGSCGSEDYCSGCAEEVEYHYHNSSCYGGACILDWVDDEIKLGIKLDVDSINKAVVSDKRWAIRYDANYSSLSWTETDDTIRTNKHYGIFYRTTTNADTQRHNGYNLIAMLFRGQDKLTLAAWKNKGAATSYLTTLSSNSAYNFKSANTPQGVRKAGDEYIETFKTKFLEETRNRDNSTRYGSMCGSTKRYEFTNTNNSIVINDIKVRVELFWANGIGPNSNAPYTSNQLAGSASFYPYIRMRYDNDTQEDQIAYVLGQRKRAATFYDFASVSITGNDAKLVINSNQWSTHADAKAKIKEKFASRSLTASDENRIYSSILPGGASLSLAVHGNATRKISIVTIQAYLEGAGLKQVTNTGGQNTLPTDKEALKAIHESLVSSVASKASELYIAQYITTGVKFDTSEMSGAQLVKPGEQFNGNGTTFSTDSKYHFNNYTETKLNINVGESSFTTYTFYTDTMGNIRCSVGNTSPSEQGGTIIAPKGVDTVSGGNATMVNIANKTGVVASLRRALVDNEGDDTEAPWASTDGKWYNEAFDGVTYLYGSTNIDVGLWDPLERTTALDPKETPVQVGKESFFNSFNTSYFKSTIDGGPVVSVGTFTNSKGSSRALSLDFGKIYESDVFYIPNVTTQDLK